jgi:hypothetical protein
MNQVNWRDLLASLSPNDKKVVMNAINIKPSTLSRWINGKGDPGKVQDIQKLAEMYPAIAASLQEEFPRAFQEGASTNDVVGPQRIPQTSQQDVIDDLAWIAEPISLFTLTNKVFTYMVSQLDPSGEGLLILPVMCDEPDKNGKVRYLVANEGCGTGPWRFQRFSQSYRIGKESLCGSAFMKWNPVFFPPNEMAVDTDVLGKEEIKSAGAFPLLRRGNRIAGVLLIASTQENFFVAKSAICGSYANFYAMTLFQEQFYPQSQIDLVDRIEQNDNEKERTNV